MRRQKETAEFATAQKAAFLANISHEIRTPMTAILGFSDVLYFESDRQTAPRQRIDAIRAIKRNAEYLLELINDILDLAKIEAGKVEVCRHRCSAIQVVGEVVSLLRMRAEEKHLSLDVHFDGPQPQSVHTDPTRLRQILVNLLSNAIKFTDRGNVTVTVKLIDTDTDDPQMQIQVSDTGIGISPAEATRLFRQYSQASPYTSRQYGGTGLGLAISKQLAELLGGTITLESELGRGSTFTLTIATGSLEGVQLLDHVCETELGNEQELFGLPPESNVLSGRVLLAEDGPDNQRLLKHVLETAGAEVTVVDNGESALELALRAWEQGDPYDVILMDMHMPVLDGYGATLQLRRASYPGAIVALTALAMDSDRQRCLEAGCDAYATKPFDRKQLLELVRGFCRQGAHT
jgi:CheY-like chemotaxis protein/anti-sigma regulatory factor (Ser/Thr protein kinase)